MNYEARLARADRLARNPIIGGLVDGIAALENGMRRVFTRTCSACRRKPASRGAGGMCGECARISTVTRRVNGRGGAGRDRRW